MKGLTFQLSGKTAFFKKPDVNSSVYMTYNNIHKVALLGILGAILGLGGHEEQYQYNKINKKAQKVYPEFYEILKDLKVSIIPRSKNGQGHFTKKLQWFNNSVGYASKEEGGNLIVIEYWLENPKWDIYLLAEDQELMLTLSEHLLNNKAVYTPYLGKNDHLADIDECREVEIVQAIEINKIDSLVPLDRIISFTESRRKKTFMYKEMLPIERTPKQLYKQQMFIFTNQNVHEVKDLNSFYEVEDKIIYMI